VLALAFNPQHHYEMSFLITLNLSQILYITNQVLNERLSRLLVKPSKQPKVVFLNLT